jgi:hypothetical protein
MDAIVARITQGDQVVRMIRSKLRQRYDVMNMALLGFLLANPTEVVVIVQNLLPQPLPLFWF